MGSDTSKIKIAMICIIGFVSVRDKKQQSVLLELLQLVLELNIRLKKFDANQHNHVAEARKVSCLKACIQMKELAQISNDLSVQIITVTISDGRDACADVTTSVFISSS